MFFLLSWPLIFLAPLLLSVLAVMFLHSCQCDNLVVWLDSPSRCKLEELPVPCRSCLQGTRAVGKGNSTKAACKGIA